MDNSTRHLTIISTTHGSFSLFLRSFRIFQQPTVHFSVVFAVFRAFASCFYVLFIEIPSKSSVRAADGTVLHSFLRWTRSRPRFGPIPVFLPPKRRKMNRGLLKNTKTEKNSENEPWVVEPMVKCLVEISAEI